VRIVDGRRARDDLGRAGVEEAQVEGEALNIVEAHLAVVLEDVVVGGAAVPLFNSDGVLQCGLVDVKVHSGVSSPVELISLCDALRDTEDGMTLLAKLVKQHHRGEIEKVDWLDRLTFREVEVVNERSKRVGSSFHLTLEFPPVRCCLSP